jgi:peptide chain release factor subunit 1
MSSGNKNEQPNEAEKNIEIWKVKKLIKRLEAARGNGTSMISLIIRTCRLRCWEGATD